MLACSVGDGVAWMEDCWFIDAVGPQCSRATLAREWTEYLVTSIQSKNASKCCCNIKGIISKIHIAKSILQQEGGDECEDLVLQLNIASLLVFDIIQHTHKHKYTAGVNYETEPAV